MNQSFFRSRILSAYDYRCCVTGLTVRPLLVASHIIPWSEDAANRLNPRNGLCLNALHDRAFDRGLMWIEPDFTIRFSPYLNESPSGSEAILNWLSRYEGERLHFANRFSPDQSLLFIYAKKSEALNRK